MVDIKSLYVEAEFNSKKIEEFVNSFVSDYEAGRITIEEIKEAFIDNLINYVDIKIISEEE